MRKILFRDIELFVTDIRIKPEERIPGYHYYAIRHDDDCQGDPVSIEQKVWVNFWGTVATREPFVFDVNVPLQDGRDYSYTQISEDEYYLFFGACDSSPVINENEQAYR